MLFFLAYLKHFELPIMLFNFITLHMKMCRVVSTSVEF